jgi:uncharacterized protein (TIRG00374 family)
MKRTLTVLLGLAFSAGAMYFLLRGNVAAVQDELAKGRYEYFVLATFVYILAFVTRAYRWRVLLNGRISLWHSFHIMMIGYMFSLLPLRVGEVARAWLTTRLDPPLKFFTAFSSIVVERVLDVAAVLVMLGFSLLLLPVPDEVSAGGATFGLVTLLMAAAMVYFAHNRAMAHKILAGIMAWLPFLGRFKLMDWLDHTLDGLEPLTNPQLAGQAVLWTALSWAGSSLAGYIAMFMFFPNASIGAVLLMLVMLALAVAIPSVPGNLGTFQAAGVAGLFFAGMVSSMEAPENAPAFAFSVVLHILNIGSYCALGVLGLYFEQVSVGQVRAGMQSGSADGQTVSESA